MKLYDRALIWLIHFLLHRLRSSQEHGRVWWFGTARWKDQGILRIGFGGPDDIERVWDFFINIDQWTMLTDGFIKVRDKIY